MSKRIPLKGTPEHARYWRDKRILGEVKLLEEQIRAMSNDTDPQRQKNYDDAVTAMVAVWEHINEGWRK